MKRFILLYSVLVILGFALGVLFIARRGTSALSPTIRPAVASQGAGVATVPFSAALPTRTSSAGAVEVQVTPLNLRDASGNLEFRVVMDTHSVPLNYDLAQLATLRTDRGDEVAASAWSGPQGGGHHASGILSFPSIRLEGMQRVALVIRDVAKVPERVFSWDLREYGGG